jgi:TonB family protein
MKSRQRLRLGMRTRLMALMSLMLGGALVVRAEELKCPKPNGDFARPYKIVTQAAGGPSYVPPKVKKVTRPKYPDSAYNNRIEGVVLVELLIDEGGCVAATRVVESIPGLDEAALACVSKWRFVPAQQDGHPVATVAQAPISFHRF